MGGGCWGVLEEGGDLHISVLLTSSKRPKAVFLMTTNQGSTENVYMFAQPMDISPWPLSSMRYVKAHRHCVQAASRGKHT